MLIVFNYMFNPKIFSITAISLAVVSLPQKAHQSLAIIPVIYQIDIPAPI